MSVKLPISVTLITRNEERHVLEAIRSVLNFASEIIVVDSESTDQTLALAKSLGVRTFTRRFDGFGQQKNFAHDQATQLWVLNIDADERITSELEIELREFFKSAKDQKFSGAYLPRKTWYLNRWIMHGGWYPNYLIRFSRRELSKWSEPNLHEALSVNGEVTHFQKPIEHYSFPSQRSHILKNVEYAALAEKSLLQNAKVARVFDVVLRPIYKFFDMFFIKRGFLDGMAGFLIAVHSAYALFLRYAYLYEDNNGKSN